jgi:hypothetical protein
MIPNSPVRCFDVLEHGRICDMAIANIQNRECVGIFFADSAAIPNITGSVMNYWLLLFSAIQLPQILHYKYYRNLCVKISLYFYLKPHYLI